MFKHWRLPYESLSREQVKQIKTDLERESHCQKGIQDLIRSCWNKKSDNSTASSSTTVTTSTTFCNEYNGIIARLFIAKWWISNQKVTTSVNFGLVGLALSGGGFIGSSLISLLSEGTYTTE
ncbi:hypothetical protein ACTA71_005063 [Dictyostelium dimigraforme]